MKILIFLSIVLGFFSTSAEFSQGANLAIRKSGPSSANPGELITYTITYSNSASTLESNVVITDYLPDAANCTYYSSFPSGVYNTVLNTITWNSAQIPGLARLDAGSGENTIQVTLRVGKPGTGIDKSNDGYYLNASSATLSSYADIKSDQTIPSISSKPISTIVNYDCTFKISQPGAGIKSASNSTLTYFVALTNTGNIYQKYSLTSSLLSGQYLNQSIQDLNGGAISETPFVAPGGTYFFHYVLKTPQHDGTKPDLYTETKITATPNICGVTHEAIYNTYVYGGAYNNYKLLSVYKIDTSDPIQSGSQLTYQIVIANVGDPLDNVRLTETYPSNTSFLSASTSVPSVTTGNNVWDFPILPSGNTIIEVTLDVPKGLSNGTTLSNTVEVSNDGTTYDTYTELTTVTSAPDLVITKTASVENSTAGPGSTVNYTLTYSNIGNFEASGIVIKDDYDDDYMNVGDIGTGINAGGEITWNIPGPLIPGDSKTLHYSMTIKNDVLLFLNGSTNIINSAYISSNLPDGNISDNTATATVNVFVLPDLKIEKTADPAIGLANQPITYTLSVSNVGKIDHIGGTYTVVDYLPAGTTYLSSTPEGATNNAGIVSWTISDDLPVDEPKNFTVTLGALPCSFVGTGTLINNASVNSNSYGDSDNSNNEVKLITDVVDNDIPTIGSTAPVTANNDSGKCSAEVTLAVPSTADNCGILSVTNNHPSTTFPVGTTTVKWSVTDIHGNVATADQNVIVKDVTAPVIGAAGADQTISCPDVPVFTAPTAHDQCSAATVHELSDVTTPGASAGIYSRTKTWDATDAAGNHSMPVSQTITVQDVTAPITPILADVNVGECSGTPVVPTTSDNCEGIVTGTTTTVFPITTQGTTVVTWTFDDGNGNETTANQNVIVKDVTDPVADVQTLPTLTGECGVTVTAPTATDNCEGPITGTTEDVLTYSAQGNYTILWTYDDGHGNTSTQTQTVVVDDVTPPETPILADVIVGECSGTPPTPTTTDNCKGTVMGTTSILFPKTKQGKHTIIWTFDDGNGNVTTAYQNLIVDDITAPVADVETLPALTDECSVIATAPTATDNCKGTIVGTTEDPTTYTIQGTYTIHWTYDDGNGNTSSQTQTVVVDDITPPETPILADVIVGECSGTPPTPTTVDNCAGIVMGKTSIIFPKTKQGKNTIIWNFDDGNGNVTSAYQNLIVEDITAPVANVASLPTITGECGVTVPAPTAMDNCEGTIMGTTEDALTYSAQGTYTIHWTYDDGNGNTSTQMQTVVVDDTTPPEITGVIAVMTVEGCDLADATPAVNTIAGLEALGLSVSDACTAKTALSISSSDVLTGTVPKVVTRTYTITDANHNGTNYSQTILLVDTQKPIIICPEAKNVMVDSGKCTASGLILGTPVTSDNCSIASVNNDAPEVFPIGSTIVTWTVTDASGNIITCSQMVNVKGLPVAVDDNISVNEDDKISGNVMENDEGLCTMSVLVKSHTEPEHGSLTIAGNGSYTYTPEDNYHGTDKFTYQICSLEGICSEATVTITIKNSNDMPIAKDDTHTIQLDLVLQGDVAENDIISGDGGNVWTIMDPPAHGTILFHPDGTYTYTPSSDFLGSDSFTYKLCDTDGDCSQAKVSIRIEDVLLPNQILTPNGDGVNDTFIIVGINLYPQNKLTMYNRWGNVVYQKNNYQNEWEGNSNVSKIGSKSLPVGTYYYLVDYGKNRHKTGFVYLDR